MDAAAILAFVLLVCVSSVAIREGARANEETATPVARTFNERVTALAASILNSPFGRNISTGDARRVALNVLSCADRYNLPPALLLSIIQVESGFRVDARNGRSAGLMQVQHRQIHGGYGGAVIRVTSDSVLIPGNNIALGAQLLNDYHGRFVRDGLEAPNAYDFSIRAYNVGPSGISRRRAVSLHYLGQVRLAMHYWSSQVS